MYKIADRKKQDPGLRWNLPDRVFFACGACHILAYAFLEKYADADAKALWIKPARGFTGNHIVVSGSSWAFDYHGYSKLDRLLRTSNKKLIAGGRDGVRT